MRKTKEQKAITLIALIITIVVLLILAAVTIQAIQGDGIIVHALKAREDYTESSAKEEVQLALNDLKIQSAIRDIDEVTYLQEKLGEDATSIETTGKGNFIIEYKGYEIVIGDYGISNIGKIEQDNNDGDGNDDNTDNGEIDWEEVFANAQRHPDQETTIPEIGIDMYGNAVNLGDWYYELNEEDKTFATGKGLGSKAQVGYIGEISSEGKIIGEIPQYIIKDNEKYTLTSLKGAFTNRDTLKIAPEIPNTVTELGLEKENGAFEGCKLLTTAPTIPNSVRYLSRAFRDCTSLTTAPTIPNSVTDMYETFAGCISLTTAPAIPNSVTDMSYTFWSCTSLTTAPAIPNSVTDMSYTFWSCTSLTTAPTIPNSVTDMYHTFYGCTSLTTAPTIPNLVTSLRGTFYGCTSLKTAPTIPNSVTDMYETFSGCTSLKTAPTIPNSVMDNMYHTFYECYSLTGDLIINARYVSVYDQCLYDAAINDGCNLIVSGTSLQLNYIIATKSGNSHITKGN